MYTARIELTFDAGHRLLKYKGKCETPHGHTFKAEILLDSETTDQLGFVADFVDIKERVGRWVDDHWDHAFLVNDEDQELLHALNSVKEKRVFSFHGQNPTAETMAKYLYDQVRESFGDMVSIVRIWESPHQYAEYREK